MALRKSTASDAKTGGNANASASSSTPSCPLDNAAALGIRQVMDSEGQLIGDLADPEIPNEQLMRLYETMVLVRAIDDRGWTLQRSGRVEFWIPHRGLEGVHNAATLAFDAKDWIWMGYRHPGVMLLRGVALLQLFTQFFGRVGEPLKGRRLPTMMGDGRVNIVPMTTQVGSYIPHACGAAWGAKLKGHDTRFLAIFGDGATSRGEFHSGMNFAGIHKPPIVFVCENNGWAISTPQSLQTASATFAEKGDAYGIRNLRVDGNDPLAVYSVVREARDLAPTQGASLIEAITYRMGFHTSSDNPDLYRTEEEVAIWQRWDPLTRMRKYLERKELWDDAREEALWTRCKSDIADAVNQAETLDFPHPASMFDDTFQDLTWMLEEQRAQLLADLEDPS
jgi:pyruvate dehydrogenase E1 component alpha subunit